MAAGDPGTSIEQLAADAAHLEPSVVLDDLVEARRDGTARRMLATPTAWAVVFGQGLGQFAILVVQATFIIALGAGVSGVSWETRWAPPLWSVRSRWSARASACCSARVARSNEQATSLGPPVGIALAMLGGAMWPLEIVGPLMRTVGHLTPHAWALEAFIDLMGSRAIVLEVLAQVGILLAFSAVLLPLASFRLRRSLGA
jgi:ABC-2 type transport system permease protein